MFEKTHLIPDGLKSGPEMEARALRTMSWAELSSRFKAMRDYRRTVSPVTPVRGGSFAPDAAARLVHPQHGIEPVNPDGSTLGKDTCATLAGIEISR